MELHVNRYASWEPGPQMGVRDRALGRRAPGSWQSLGDRVGGGGGEALYAPIIRFP